jgi:phage terminase small subunit
MPANKLTGKQEKFCQAIADGKTQLDAYKFAYNASKMKDSGIYVNASRLLDNTKITLRIDELKKAVEKKYLWTREMSQRILGSIAIKSAGDNNRIAAIRELNLMNGFNGNPTDDDYVPPVSVTIQVQSAKRNSAGQ